MRSVIFEMIWNAFRYGQFKHPNFAEVELIFKKHKGERIELEVRNYAYSKRARKKTGTRYIDALVQGMQRLGQKDKNFNKLGFQFANFDSDRRGDIWVSSLVLPIQ